MFLLYFLLRRDYRAAAMAGFSFAAATAAGFALAGRDSARYWSAAVFQTGRIGGPATAANQSIVAVLARAGLDPHTPAGLAAWLTLSAVVVVVACRGMRRALAAREDCLALVAQRLRRPADLAGVLVAPLGMVRARPAHPGLSRPPPPSPAGHGGRRLRPGPVHRRPAMVARASSPARHQDWPPWQQAIGSSYVCYAALVLLLAGRLVDHPGWDGVPRSRSRRSRLRILPTGLRGSDSTISAVRAI